MDAKFIVAADPDSSNVENFIRLIRTYKPNCIVSMTVHDDLNKKSFSSLFRQLYFSETSSIKIGRTKIAHTDVVIKNNIKIQNLIFTFERVRDLKKN